MIRTISDKSKNNNEYIFAGIKNEQKNKLPPTKYFISVLKWAWQDSNLRPTDYESVALTN